MAAGRTRDDGEKDAGHRRVKGNRVLPGRAAGGPRPRAGLARPAPAAFPGESREAGLAGRRATGAALEKVLSGGPVDAVVSNGGLGRAGMTGAVDLGDLAGPYDLKARAAVQVTQAALPSMRARGRGRVVNDSSMVTVGLVDRTAHGAAKAAPWVLLPGLGERPRPGRDHRQPGRPRAEGDRLSDEAGYITGQTLRVYGGGSSIGGP